MTLEVIGALAAALFAAVALVDHQPRRRAWAMLGVLLVTPVLLVGHVWDTPQSIAPGILDSSCATARRSPRFSPSSPSGRSSPPACCSSATRPRSRSRSRR